MIYVICGHPGIGKTAFLTHVLVQAMFDRKRYLAMKKAIEAKHDGDFARTIPQHPVYANYYINGRKYLYRPRTSHALKPFHLGFCDDTNKEIEMHHLPPFAVVGITEGQKYLNSRKSAKYPDWQSRWYEAHRHNNYDIYIDIQRFDLVDLNIRELAQFIEIQGIEHLTKRGKTMIRWTIRRFETAREMERYMSSGKKDTTTYTEEKVKADYNVHDCYDSQMCEPQFYKGHLDNDYNTAKNLPPPHTKKEYADYHAIQDDDCPPMFYGTKSKLKGGDI